MGSDTPSFEATIHVEEIRDPDALYRALLPETGEFKRFGASIRKEGEAVIIKIVAKDPTALRAALNSYLRLIALLSDIEERL